MEDRKLHGNPYIVIEAANEQVWRHIAFHNRNMPDGYAEETLRRIQDVRRGLRMPLP